MRAKLFRTLAGLVAGLFFLVLALGDFDRKPALEVALFAVLACLFALYAAFGQAAADRWLNMWFRVPLPEVRDVDASAGPNGGRDR